MPFGASYAALGVSRHPGEATLGERFRAKGGRSQDLLRLAEQTYPTLPSQMALRRLLDDAERARRAPASDRFDTPYDPNWKKDGTP